MFNEEWYDSTWNRIMHAMKMVVGTKKLTCNS
jgi:hypothetical protein